jgi:hypothetical protein
MSGPRQYPTNAFVPWLFFVAASIAGAQDLARRAEISPPAAVVSDPLTAPPVPLPALDAGIALGRPMPANFGLLRGQDEAPKAAAPAGDDAELSKKLSNPVADLISVPIQFNYNEGFGPDDGGQVLVNIQPVIPFSISENWNLITRTILPVIWQGSTAPGVDDEFGIGDTTQSFFFSPKRGDLVWGVGPAFLWPTGTPSELSSRKWGVGPTAVVLKQSHGWTFGALANHIWSYAGEEDMPEVNQTFLQPFVSYTWPTATSITLNTESTYDWTDEEWTVPINLMAGQIVRLGRLPVQFQIGGRYYAESPPDGPEWGLRFAIVFLFPK